ncbi:allophanate hydrolase [Pseudomonas plecoglossicida]|uniref:Allophanate hydrolase n=1 Tax=Pseudomonas plecoglossicida TaxID=70775 RepID=A0ABX4TVQ7_PSEDL|nr:5-oxoprolinase subunit PxpB [Pseudomonas plecoglossicida]PLU85250.1 allophanate hydrolase [Pseudomonas plecoglossicida]PLU90619.1 allophanate hydrolase [Pseudomonas plecoglossicida]PLV02009.1 allophanate hydrolase [Pseudomonas plecoglossicida]PLV10325.1 allophanate hydrolase [Pseudomonas plecoglossicida]
MKPRIEVVAIDSLMVRLFDGIDEGNMPWMFAASQRLHATFGKHLLDLVPSYTTLMVQFDLPPGEARALIIRALEGLQPDTGSGGRRHEIPVWYDASVGPELPVLAARSGLSEAEVVRLHSEREYPVFALGFAPGFGFMGLVDERLASPRLSTPRKRVAAGSVGIAERQTAAYPAVSPGGWNLIGRTLVRLFDHEREGYSLLQPGDRVRFVPVSRSDFVALGGDVEAQA